MMKSGGTDLMVGSNFYLSTNGNETRLATGRQYGTKQFDLVIVATGIGTEGSTLIVVVMLRQKDFVSVLVKSLSLSELIVQEHH